MEIKDKTIAMLIDAENISHENLESIIEKMYKYGKITIRRIYGDWTSQNMKSWQEKLLEFSFRPIQNFKSTNSKNSSDIALVIDAMDILYSGRVDCFILVSGDSDFTGLISRIRESNLTVIGIGEKEKTSESLIKSCDRFEFIDDLKDDKQENEHTKKSKEIENKDTKNKELKMVLRKFLKKQILDRAYEQTINESGTAFLSEIASVCTKLDPSFNPKNYSREDGKNISGYRDFFECFSDDYEIIVHNDGCTYSIKKIESDN